MIEPNQMQSVKEVDLNEIPDTISDQGASTEADTTDTQEQSSEESQEQSGDTTETTDTTEESSADSTGATADAQSSEQQSNEEEFYDAEEVADLTSQFTNGEFTNPAELYSKYTELKSKQDPLATVSPFIKKLAEFEKSGGDPRFFVETQTLDYSKMEPKEILRQKFIKDKPGLGREDANILFESQFKRKYGQLTAEDVENLSPEEKRALEVELKVESNEAKGDLEKWQKDSAVFKPKEEDAKSQEEQQAYIQNHLNTVKQVVAELQGINVPVTDAESDDFKYVVAPENKQKIESWMSDPHGAFLSAIAENDKGEIDYPKFRLAAAILADPDGYSKTLYKYAFAKGQEKLVTERKNQAQPGSTSLGSQAKVKSEQEQLNEQYFNS
jgi:hypothetical protein